MSETPTSGGSSRAAELREAFDRARALPFASGEAEQMESLLAIRLGGEPHAIRVSEIAALARGRKIEPVPGGMPELLGIAGMRGEIVPVYSLAALVGHGREAGEAAWLVLCGGEERVGFAFHDFEGHLRVPLAQLCAAGERDAGRDQLEHVVRAEGSVRTVVSLSQLLSAIRTRCRPGGGSKER
ncbi:MAG TPA: chemotaxis protein CheW [Candidatus Acidoferrales bacterium]|nr:chemotaxis protein CheW [Candidatus Acidoferrales bacterium]